MNTKKLLLSAGLLAVSGVSCADAEAALPSQVSLTSRLANGAFNLAGAGSAVYGLYGVAAGLRKGDVEWLYNMKLISGGVAVATHGCKNKYVGWANNVAHGEFIATTLTDAALSARGRKFGAAFDNACYAAAGLAVATNGSEKYATYHKAAVSFAGLGSAAQAAVSVVRGEAVKAQAPRLGLAAVSLRHLGQQAK